MKEAGPREELERKQLFVATGVLHKKDGRVLLLKRSEDHKIFQGFWQLPEGKIEFGESPQEALNRELEEEIGRRAGSSELLGVHSGLLTIGLTIYHVIRIIFEVGWEGRVKLSKEHIRHRWVLPRRALVMRGLLPGTEEILWAVLKKGLK